MRGPSSFGDRNTAAIVVALAVFAIFAFPLFVTGGAALTRGEAAIDATTRRQAGLDLLESEHDVHRAIRTLRSNALAAGSMTIGDRLVLDRAIVRLVDLIDRGEFREPLAPEVKAIRSAWDRVPDGKQSLEAIDAVLAADEDLVTAIRQHADLGVGSTALIESGVRLYDELLPSVGDRVDDQRNLILTAAATGRITNGTDTAIGILRAQAIEFDDASIAAARRIQSASPTGDLLGPVRRVGLARARFDDAVHVALERGRISREANGRVRDGMIAVDRDMGAAEIAADDIVSRNLDEMLASERLDDERAHWIAAIEWFLGLASSIGAGFATRAWARESKQRFDSLLAERVAVTQARLDAIFERATIGVALFDVHGTLSRANRALEILLGRAEAGAIGARHESFAKLAEGEIEGFTVPLSFLRDGEPCFAESSFSLVRDTSGSASFVIAFVRDTTDRVSVERRLRYEATYDAVSRLPNRTSLLERLQRTYVAGAAPSGVGIVAYLHLDRDRSPGFRASRGGAEEAVARFSARLAGSLEPNAFLARHEGNGFVAVLDGAPDRASAKEAVERIVRRLALPDVDGEAESYLVVSTGVTFADRPFSNAAEMVDEAELAMRDARARGSTDVAVFTPDLRDRLERLTAMGAALRRALERDQLYVDFQPVFSSRDRSIHGFEALVRWNHPELGFVSPADFIPVAEQLGSIVPIGRWVLDRACAQLAIWQRFGDGRHYTMAINASVHEVMRPDYATFLERTLERHGLAPEQIVIEVTESVVLESGRFACGALAALRELGVGLAIDDFGTGFSSMRYLLEFPFTELKIDGSFVRGGDGGLASEPIVATLVSLARSLGVATVAEGVETEAQAARLIALGVDVLQGYHLSRPLNPSGVTEMLRREAWLRELPA